MTSSRTSPTVLSRVHPTPSDVPSRKYTRIVIVSSDITKKHGAPPGPKDLDQVRVYTITYCLLEVHLGCSVQAFKIP